MKLYLHFDLSKKNMEIQLGMISLVHTPQHISSLIINEVVNVYKQVYINIAFNFRNRINAKVC